MWPLAGENLLKYCGDWVQFRFGMNDSGPIPAGWRVFLRTTLGRERLLEEEIIHAHSHKWPLEGDSWRDIPMPVQGNEACLNLPIHEVGYFEAKPYALDEQNRQIWPDGTNIGISVHPDFCRTNNTIYCAFTRLFGENIAAEKALPEKSNATLSQLDQKGFTCIPPSGKFRDLIRQLPHIIDTLGCKIIHLLPVNPTPTTMARMGRFGSPYAALDLTGIDLALVEFEEQTTAVDQFCELSDAIHQHRARLIIDLAINHTGWGSSLHSSHPEWYVRDAHGKFVSPGAWGVTWGDLSELNTHLPELWEYLAGVFITWCQRGVDGFRCDAGYKIPMEAWRYIISRVHQKFPETFFLLEGLGGSWEATETLLTKGRMQFAYSELFQNYSSKDIAWYLNYSLKQSTRRGVWVHYSETHDNNRLAARGKRWSLFRNQLSALTSVCGGFGFTCGVEWLATEKIDVHQRSGLAWGNPNNIVPELAKLNRLLADHPCFFDNARLSSLTHGESPVYVLRRDSADNVNTLWIFANTDMDHTSQVTVIGADMQPEMHDLLTDKIICPLRTEENGQRWIFEIPAGTCWCLSKRTSIQGLSGENYRKKRSMASWALIQVCQLIPDQKLQETDWLKLAQIATTDPTSYLAAVSHLANQTEIPAQWAEAIQAEMQSSHYKPVVQIDFPDLNRITLLPKDHWLILRTTKTPFQMQLRSKTDATQMVYSVSTDAGHIAAISPKQIADIIVNGENELILEGIGCLKESHTRSIRLLYVSPILQPSLNFEDALQRAPGGKDQWLLLRGDQFSLCKEKNTIVLLTNGRGGMARICADFGTVQSKYDCLLGANLSPEYPEDRHIFVKRARAWVNADGFFSELNSTNLAKLNAEPPAKWDFVVSAGEGRIVHLRLTIDLLEERNTLIMRLERLNNGLPEKWKPFLLSPKAHVSVTIRLDIEDRNFHTETHLNPSTRQHFSTNTHPLSGEIGFTFTPDPNRQFCAYATKGTYHPQEEWCENIWHPVEGNRGQPDHGDAYSPGWFELPLETEKPVLLVVDAEPERIKTSEIEWFEERRVTQNNALLQKYDAPITHIWERELVLGLKPFLVRRESEWGKTVIAGYPWFLDWGRDTLICARGYLAAGYWDEVLELLQVFGSMERNGTLPNVIYGNNDSNRDTSDAPLWFGVVTEEMAACAQEHRTLSEQFYQTPVNGKNRTLLDILKSIANSYLKGTPNGISVDKKSALVWSPAHFTWMDTNYPAGTPRCGYPIEIQALWIRLLRQLEHVDSTNPQWKTLADKATVSLQRYYWLPTKGWFADGLWAENKAPASQARVDDALRPNQYLAVAFGFFQPEQAQSAIRAGLSYLLIPGAMRSLAPLPVDCLAPIYGPGGTLLNDPGHPYWPHYEGDEDTRRKPAYHNGTAWGFLLPTFCEAITTAWEEDPLAQTAARAYLKSAEYWMSHGCLGQIPEIMDGDAPHTPRGCDAQAWSICETLRVWKHLTSKENKTK